MSNPSVNHPYTGANSSRACRTLPWSRQRRARLMAARNSQEFACCWAGDSERAFEMRLCFSGGRLRRQERDFASGAMNRKHNPARSDRPYGLYGQIVNCTKRTVAPTRPALAAFFGFFEARFSQKAHRRVGRSGGSFRHEHQGHARRARSSLPISLITVPTPSQPPEQRPNGWGAMNGIAEKRIRVTTTCTTASSS